jgi:hypothetical protein
MVDVMASALGCYDCGRKYSSDAWVEAVVSESDWLAISPTGHSGGILCIGCMADRFVAKGMSGVSVMLTAGPFAIVSAALKARGIDNGQ